MVGLNAEMRHTFWDLVASGSLDHSEAETVIISALAILRKVAICMFMSLALTSEIFCARACTVFTWLRRCSEAFEENSFARDWKANAVSEGSKCY